MHIVVIRVPVAGFSEKLASMRSWLDQNRCTPLKFTSNRYNGIMSVRIEFMNITDAERFKEEFGGKEPNIQR
jgi:hypothetical protein